jgi:hypothetical protein
VNRRPPSHAPSCAGQPLNDRQHELQKACSCRRQEKPSLNRVFRGKRRTRKATISIRFLRPKGPHSHDPSSTKATNRVARPRHTPLTQRGSTRTICTRSGPRNTKTHKLARGPARDIAPRGRTFPPPPCRRPLSPPCERQATGSVASRSERPKFGVGPVVRDGGSGVGARVVAQA